MSENVLIKVGNSFLMLCRSALNWLAGSSGRTFIVIFTLAFGIRAYTLRHIPVINLLPKSDRELGAIASSLVATGRFANPYMIPTGPIAHLPLIPPTIFEFICYWFGRTNITGYIFIGFIIMISSALMPWIADKIGAGRSTGFVLGLFQGCQFLNVG